AADRVRPVQLEGARARAAEVECRPAEEQDGLDGRRARALVEGVPGVQDQLAGRVARSVQRAVRVVAELVPGARDNPEHRTAVEVDRAPVVEQSWSVEECLG